MIADPAVRSVRIAVTLSERFAELLKGPSTVSAKKQSGALFGVSGNEEALSLRIGEVQQTYPEIWRHLDDARTAFAARGIDVSAYDQIRASEGVALGAAVDVTHQRHGAGQYAVDEVTKSANFNIDGYKRAINAAKALMAATPEIDWAGIAKAEAEDPNIKAFTRSTTTKRYVMIGLLAAVIAAPFLYVWNERRQKQNRIDARREAHAQPSRPPPPVDRTQLDKAIAPVRQRFVAAQQAWPTATAPEALAAVTPTDKPCEYTFAAPAEHEVEGFVKYGNPDKGYYTEGAFVTFGAGEIPSDLQLRGPLYDLDFIKNEAALARLPTHAVFVIIDKEVQPVPGTGKAYTPGQLTGRSYVYSIAQAKLVCAGVVHVTNTPALDTPPQDAQAKQMLFRDLEVQIRKALATGLRAM